MKRTILVTILIAILITISQAATYTWDGSEGDGDWNNETNWTVTGSADGYLWPNQQYGSEYVNHDCEYILITNGDAVSKWKLSPDGERDGSTTCTLRIANGSQLSSSLIWIGDANSLTKGRIEVLNGGILNVYGNLFDVSNDGTGTLVGSNSTILVATKMRIGPGYSTGYATFTDCTVTNAQTEIGGLSGSEGHLTVNGNTMMKNSGHTIVGYKAGSVGYLTVDDNAVMKNNGDIMIGYTNGATGYMEVKGNAVVTNDSSIFAGFKNGSTGYLSIADNAVVTLPNRHLQIAQEAGAHGEVIISDNADVNVNGIYFCDWSGSGAYGKLTINGGKLTTHYNVYVNDDGEGEGYFIINDGECYINGKIDIPSSTAGKGHFVMNGGFMKVTSAINIGYSSTGGGQGRLTISGGQIICNDLNFKDDGDKVKETGEFDGIVVFTDGELLVNQSYMSKSDMQAYIDGGWIDASSVPNYKIKTINAYGADYTALVAPHGIIFIIK